MALLVLVRKGFSLELFLSTQVAPSASGHNKFCKRIFYLTLSWDMIRQWRKITKGENNGTRSIRTRKKQGDRL